MQDKSINRIDFFMLFTVVTVVICGIITLYSQEVNFSESSGRWIRQLVYFIIGLIIILFLSRVNYQLIGYYALFFYLGSIVLLILTLIPGIGYLPEGRGARSWIKIGPLGIQVSEFTKLATVILLGQYLVVKEKEMRKITVLFVPFLIAIIPMFFIILQPDFGTAISFLPILFTMLFMGGADLWHIGSLVMLGGISLSVPMFLEYTKIILLGNFQEFLEIQKDSALTSVVNKLGVKVWNVYEGKNIPMEIDSGLKLKITELVQAVKDEHAGFLFNFFHNDSLILFLSISLILVAAVMIMFKMARGMSGLRNYYLATGILGLSLLLSLVIYKTIPFSTNQVVRLTAFVNPDQFRQGAGYQLRASKTAVGSGQLFGKGILGAEMTEGRIPHVPESGTDFIFASWAEQTGFVGSILLIFLLLSIPLRGLQISYESKDRFGSLLAAGIVALIFFHIAINIGIVLGLLPITGIPLSFMSYGGSHLVMSMTAAGILISIKSRKHAN